VGSVGEVIRAWMPLIVGAFLAVWGVYTFYFSEILKPKTAPVNVSLDLHTQAAGVANAVDGGSLSAIVVDVKATNPSTRAIYILPSISQAFGKKIGIPKDGNHLVKALRSAIDANAESEEEEYAESTPELIAVGRPFAASILQPNETIKRSFLIHFPQNKYDLLEVTLILPTVAEPDKVRAEWNVLEHNVVAIKFYRIDSGKAITRDDNGRYRDDNGRYDESLGLQLEVTRAELSLWH
jgi:hypothetical protein